ncbi:MAG: hypothetical protein JO056_00405 [Alphaproteobacteria bacterium]|nr:hypothetical protein [Alphaproteobacteria bacterium]
MRKCAIIAAAAAALTMSGTAEAKGPVLNLGDICKSLLLIVDHARVSGYPIEHCQIDSVVGAIGKVTGTEGRSIIGGLEMRGHRRPYLIEISYPMVDGGTWRLYVATHQYKSKLYRQGTYTVRD